MVFLQVFGALIALAGLGLFVREQIREKTGEHSTMQAWKVNLSGPPSLIVMVVGIALFVFPFTPWWEDNTTPPTTTSTTTATTTTVFYSGVPTTPFWVGTYYDDFCQDDLIEWSDDYTAYGWEVDVDVYDDQGFLTSWTVDVTDAAFLCAQDFVGGTPGLSYDLWVWAYAEEWAEEPLLIQYYDS